MLTFVIVKKDNRIILYCKGADTIIYELLSSKSAHIMDETQTHLDAFACNGLRTLCLASRELSEEEYGEWYEQFLEASTALEDRDEKLNQVCTDFLKLTRYLLMPYYPSY